MYENYKLCPNLRPEELCVVLEQYKEGGFERQFHHHISRRRLSAETKVQLLQALVVRFFGFTGMGAEQIVHAHLNTTAKSPAATNELQIVTSYPEAGVIRRYCGTNTKAWIDEVIVPREFRKI